MVAECIRACDYSLPQYVTSLAPAALSYWVYCINRFVTLCLTRIEPRFTVTIFAITSVTRQPCGILTILVELIYRFTLVTCSASTLMIMVRWYQRWFEYVFHIKLYPPALSSTYAVQHLSHAAITPSEFMALHPQFTQVNSGI
ncbi:hypothetical protein D1872_72770 [compost metagenome]